VSGVSALVLAGGDDAWETTLGLAPWGATTVLEHVVEVVRAAGVGEVVVVLGRNADAVAGTVELPGVTLVEDPEWEEGTAAQLRAGMDVLQRSSESDAVMILEVVQPNVDVDAVRAVADRQLANRSLATVPKYRYTWGPPLIVHRDLWPRLLSREGEAGLEALLRTHPEWVDEVWIDRLPPTRVSTPDELAELAPRR
jgi:molybdenum cofactor cytidylyltransferase